MMKVLVTLFLFMQWVSTVNSNPLMFGTSLLFFSFFLVFYLMWKSQIWFSFIFFLMYVGAVLVLVFYVVCVNSNPVYFNISVNQMLMFIVMSGVMNLFLYFSQMKLNFNHVSIGLKIYSYYKFFLMIFLFFMLLLMLWVISKFSFLSIGGLRNFI